MGKVSKQTATAHSDEGPGEEWRGDIEGYTVNFVRTTADADLAPLLKGLPDDRCQCPHWGYVIAGQLTWHYADHDETNEAGDAFYIPAGHTPAAAAGTEFVLFSPAEQLAETEAVIARNAQAMQGA